MGVPNDFSFSRIPPIYDLDRTRGTDIPQKPTSPVITSVSNDVDILQTPQNAPGNVIENYLVQQTAEKLIKERDAIICARRIITQHNIPVDTCISDRALLWKAIRDYDVKNLIKKIDLSIYPNDTDQEKISFLPPEIGDLIAVESLSVNNNNLTNLPPEIGSMFSLTQLWLEGNKLTTVPPKLFAVPCLYYLNLKSNNITEMPSTYTRLFILELDNNNLTKVPEGIFKYSHLRELSLCNNNLRDLPAELNNLEQLQKILLSGNKLEDASQKIDKFNTIIATEIRSAMK